MQAGIIMPEVRKVKRNKCVAREGGIGKMKKTNARRPCAMGKAVCATAGLAGTLLRLSAGMVAIACLGYLAAGRAWRLGKKKKDAPASASPGQRQA